MLARVLIPIAVAGCAGKSPLDVRDVVGQPLAQPAGARIAVADPVFLYARVDVEGEGAERDMEVWRANYWVGRIWFAGGFEILPEEANQVRSVVVELTEQDRYLPFVTQWVETAVPAALTAAGYELAPPVGAVAIHDPIRREIRGTTELDGSDNLNLPRFDLTPGPAVPPGVDTDADGIFVPIVVNYYSHNAGWFVGQEDGCYAGARMRVFWSLVAPDDGSVMGWGEIATSTKVYRLTTPNRQQQQDLMLAVETDARGRLTEQLATRSPR